MSDSLMTPPEVYAACEAVWGRPALDPCWHPASPVAPRLALTIHPLPDADLAPDTVYSTLNSLHEDWAAHVEAQGGGWVWLNPPYSDPGPWLEKLVTSGLPGVALLKSDHSTRWWNRWVWPHARAVGLFQERLRYARTDGGKQYAANFPSALVVYGDPYPDRTIIEDRTPPDLGITWVKDRGCYSLR